MIQELATRIDEKRGELESWFEKRFGDSLPPVYSSVDLRNAGFKISVVDTNLFPAGFNNLCETFSEKASAAFKEFFQKNYPAHQKILLIPEEHTRNLFYLKNIEALKEILTKADLEVHVGSPLQTADFSPDLILINNDLSAGFPEYLRGLSQPILPSPHLGWHRRRKSDHFALYIQLMREAAAILDIDPWLLYPLTQVETGIDLTDAGCLKRLQESADRLLLQIRQKYLEHGISREPYLFMKDNAGTYGLGMMTVRSGHELLALGRRVRNKLEFAKGGRRVSEYLLQEGIPTADLYKGKALEPVVYLVGGKMVGTFFRIHGEKGEMESLNSPGMTFSCLCFHKVRPPTRSFDLTYERKEELFVVAKFLGQVASLAAALESEFHRKEKAA
ncbi:MAG: glutamate--cysteine ligase [Deltaproteobacteria bacterium]|nr:glutamate--cysteine ligase [Deltaproteobacteria bacterium]